MQGIKSDVIPAGSAFLPGTPRTGGTRGGRPVTTPVSLSRKRSCPFGALSTDGFFCASCDGPNGPGFEDFLDRLRTPRG